MTIFDNKEAFGLMDPALQDEMRAWPYGYLVYTAYGAWLERVPSWYSDGIYRAIPAPLTKPSVDWTILSDKIAGIARDASGSVFAYAEKAICDHEALIWRKGNSGMIHLSQEFLPSVTPGTCGWQDSWVPNPRYKP